ncbi:ABC transporter permease [Aeromicrobium sp. Leaf350]|uniref:ABC transporter permease n=1 Tax=Aeromicrobium sp. Leaf350 TaxID=2876565 RepID=UPI001E35AB7C|nr:ABC transporter permease [Aeromicrobium sp. Leaf350]
MTVTTPDTPVRRAPARGGFSPTILRLELRRLLRNRRAVVFTLVVPSLFFLLFGTDQQYRTEQAGHGNVTAWIMVSMAVYGAMIATTSGGAMVATERAVGWSRQLRLTPLHPVAYVLVKAVVAMAMGAVAIVVVFVVGHLVGAELSTGRLVACGVLAWVCSLVFAAFGLFMGYLLPSENVMQVLGPALAVLSLAGGLFVPLSEFSDTFADVARLTPAYGVGELARAPFGDGGDLLLATLNVVAWAAVFVVGAAWRMSRDTARV